MIGRYFFVNGRAAREHEIAPGGCYIRHKSSLAKNKTVRAKTASNVWTCSEYNSNNAWNVNSSGNVNNNNKYNANAVRPVVALTEEYVSGWVEAYRDCLRGKYTSPDCERFVLTHENELMALAQEVATYTYQPRKAKTFLVTRPKLREIFAADFADRIVHHWVCLRVEPLLEERFRAQGDVSFNCRKGFGVLSAVQRVASHVNAMPDGWIGKFDIEACFMSVDKELLLERILDFVDRHYVGHDIVMPEGATRTLHDRALLKYLLTVVIRHCPQDNCRRTGSLALWRELPDKKSLFKTPRHRGMPIGNLPSQLLVNFILSFVDERMISIAAELGAGYVRFVDDAVVICRTVADVKRMRHEFAVACASVNMCLHERKVYIQPARHGVSFLGAIVKPGRTYLGNVIRGHTEAAVREASCANLTAGQAEAAGRTMNSLLGFAVHHNSYGWRNALFRSDAIRGLFRYYILTEYRTVRVRKIFKTETYLLTRFKQQDYETDKFCASAYGGGGN